MQANLKVFSEYIKKGKNDLAGFIGVVFD